MRAFVFAVLGLAALVGMVAAEPAATFKMSEDDLKGYCKRKGGHFFPSGDNPGYSCAIGQGDSAVVISCGVQKICTMYNDVVFTQPRPTHANVIGKPAVLSSGNVRITAGASQKTIAVSPLKQLGSTAATASTTMTVAPTKQVGSNSATSASPNPSAAVMSSGRATLRQP